MNENTAREMIRFSDWAQQEPDPVVESFSRRAELERKAERFKKRYVPTLIACAIFTVYSVLLASWVNYRAGREAQAETQSAVRSAVTTTENHIFDVLGITREQFLEMERAKEEGKPTILTGQESFEAYVSGEIDAVAQVISKLGTDQQKLTEAACMLARVMNPNYPNSFEEVANQPKQWMFYDGSDKTCSQHDKDLAESIVRPYLESGIIPNGLTAEMVHGAWSTNDFVLRDSYENSANMHTWRAQ
jgi:hypothetical protein